MINTAIILAAGLGSRLRPLTDTVPKCLTEVSGKPILEQQLEALAKSGIERVAIVIGYLGQEIVGAVRKFNDDIPEVRFIWNHDYATTGSAYSLWLVREYLNDGCLIIEGDVVFEPAVLPHALKGIESTWLVRKARIGDDGCLLSVKDGLVKDVQIYTNPCNEVADNLYKSRGIVRVDAEMGQALSVELEEEIEGGNKTSYKDEILGSLNADAFTRIHLADISGLKCQEIDTRNDLLKAEKRFTQPKYVVVIIDGAADDLVAQLDNRTALEHADIPHLDSLAKGGRTGLVQTMYPSLPLGSIVGMLGIMGYNPTRYYPNGRASFEAIAQDIYLEEDKIAFRCNDIIVDADGILVDAQPKNPDKHDFFCHSHGIFSPGRGYRNILTVKDYKREVDKIRCIEPHEHIGEKLSDLLPRPITLLTKNLWNFMVMTRNTLFPWSPSSAPHLPSFHSRHGIDGAIISAMDFMIGIGRVARMEARRSDTMTGYSDTDLNAKVEYTKNALKYNDIVFLHINAPDEESHAKNVAGKIDAIEKIDQWVIGPLKKHLDEQYPGNYRLAVLPDHYSYVKSGKHGDKPVPYVIYGEGVEKDGVFTFGERSVSDSSILKSYEFMEFLRG